LIVLAWVILAAAGVPWAGNIAHVPCLVLPVLLFHGGPVPMTRLTVNLRMTCFLVPLVVVHAPNHEDWGLIRIPHPVAPWIEMPTTAEIWTQIARAELGMLLLVELSLLALILIPRRSARS
jgi:hypothetical protein